MLFGQLNFATKIAGHEDFSAAAEFKESAADIINVIRQVMRKEPEASRVPVPKCDDASLSAVLEVGAPYVIVEASIKFCLLGIVLQT